MLLIKALMCSGDVLGRDNPVGERAMRLAAGRVPSSSGWGLAMSDAIRFLLGPAPSLRALRRTLLIVCRSCGRETRMLAICPPSLSTVLFSSCVVRV